MDNLIIIAAYINPNNKENLIEKALWYIQAFKEKGYDVLLTGDLNFSPKKILEKIKNKGLIMAKCESFTRVGRNNSHLY